MRAVAVPLLVALAALVGCARTVTVPLGGRAEPLRVGVLWLTGVHTADAAAPYAALQGRRQASPRVEVVGLGRTRGPVRTAEGLHLIPDRTLSDPPRLDVLVLPGGAGVRQALADPDLIEAVARLGLQARRLVAYGEGVFLLAEAGLLRGRRVTVAPRLRKTAAAEYPHLHVVSKNPCRDREVITAWGGPKAPQAVLLALRDLRPTVPR